MRTRATAVLRRPVPQMNVFIVGFPLQIGVGIIAIAVSLPLFLVLLNKLIGVMERDLFTLVSLFA